jgi:hypothetical protein
LTFGGIYDRILGIKLIKKGGQNDYTNKLQGSNTRPKNRYRCSNGSRW